MKTLIVFSAFCAIALTSPSHRIIYGDPIDITEVPFMLNLEIFNGFGYSFICGASIIGLNYVLTAGHCVNPLRPYNYRVRAGSSKVGNGIVRDVTEIRRHAQYYENYTFGIADFDIAFLTIEPIFEYSETVQPIDFTRIEPTVDDKARVTGWGFTENGNIATDLLQANLSIIGRQECEQGFTDPGIRIPKTMICAQAPKEDQGPCNGDSGGPLVVDNVIVGVASWGGSCDTEKGKATVFTNVAHFSDWVEEQIENAELSWGVKQDK